MNAGRRTAAIATVLVALCACTGSDDPRGGAGPEPEASPSVMPVRNTGLGTSGPAPRVSCQPPLRQVGIIAGSVVEPPYATTSEEALGRVLTSYVDEKDVPDSALYVRENFERIAPVKEYRKASQQAKHDRFAGYRPNASVFVIVEFERFGPENSWNKGENFELVDRESNRNRAVFFGFRENGTVFLKLAFRRSPRTGDWTQERADYCANRS